MLFNANKTMSVFKRNKALCLLTDSGNKCFGNVSILDYRNLSERLETLTNSMDFYHNDIIYSFNFSESSLLGI